MDVTPPIRATSSETCTEISCWITVLKKEKERTGKNTGQMPLVKDKQVPERRRGHKKVIVFF
jgi:hypothetical protein